MTRPRTASGICNITHHIYVVGGWPVTATCEVYDTIEDKWLEMTARLPVERCAITLVAVRKRMIFAFGGRGGYVPVEE